MEERIRKIIDETFRDISKQGIAYTVERPNDIAHGDYTTNVALIMAKQLGKNPHEVGDTLARHLIEGLGTDVASHVSVAGPGFVNIKLAREAITFAVAEADAKGTDWGNNHTLVGKRVMVEYTDPNPFKEMHIGHLMSNVIGESLARLIENEDATILRANYQGDVGPHVAKALWGLQKAGIAEPMTVQELGEAYVVGSRAYEESPNAKTEIDILNKEIYTGDNPTLKNLWRKGREVSLSAFEQIYTILGTHFDYYFFESETAESGVRVVYDGLHRGVFEESEDAIIYRGEKKGLHTLVFITSKGTPTYEAKDMGLAFLKEERAQFDESIIITASEQIGHFKVFLAALDEVAPFLAMKTKHVAHGFLRLTSGKMASREGNVITAISFIEDIIKKASERNPDPLIAEQVAIGAIKYMVLRQSPGSDIIFDPNKSLSLEGDSGPYLQYALVRAKSVLVQAEEHTNTREINTPKSPYLLERIILHFPEVTLRATKTLAPNLLVTYLTELASAWNSFYAQERIIGGEYEGYKLMLTRAYVHTMTNGLRLLGIPTPEQL